MFVVLFMTGCGMEAGNTPAPVPSVEATPDPNQQLITSLTASLGTLPSDTVITLLDGKEVRILSQIQYNINEYLDKLSQASVRDQFTGLVTSGDARMGVLLQKGANGWTGSTFSVQTSAPQQSNIESIYTQMKDQFIQDHGELRSEFFYVTFLNNPEPYSLESGETHLNEIFAQQGFSTPVVITATLKGKNPQGEEKKIVSVYQVQLALTKQ